MEQNCPNCVTYWKCNGPHLEKMSEIHYRSCDGYYLFDSPLKQWVFVPFEKNFNEENLTSILETLKYLNSN